MFDFVKDAVEVVVDDVLPELDPTNPNAEYGDVTQGLGEVGVTYVTGGAGTGLFTGITNGLGSLNQATDNAFTVNNLDETAGGFMPDDFKGFENIAADPDVFVEEITGVLPELDPTNPNAEYGDVTQGLGETVFTTIMGEEASDVFTEVTDEIGDFHQETSNTFTLNNISETADVFISETSDVFDYDSYHKAGESSLAPLGDAIDHFGDGDGIAEVGDILEGLGKMWDTM